MQSRMGSWKMEVGKMLMYVSFPVTMFIIFNAPAFYEDAIHAARTEMDRRTDHRGSHELRQFLHRKKMEKLDSQIQELNAK